MVDWLNKVAEASASTRNKYAVPGNYIVRCTAAKIFESRDGSPLFLFEGIVEEFEPAEERWAGEFFKNAPISVMYNLAKEPGPSNTKKFVLAAYKAKAIELGEDPNSVTEDSLTREYVDAMLSEDSPAQGLRFRLLGEWVEKRRSPGSFFTKTTFYPLG